MDASNTPADRAANPSDFEHISLYNGLLAVLVSNDLDREVAIRGLRKVADRLEFLRERELTGPDLRKAGTP